MFQKSAFGTNTSGFGMQSTFGASPSTSSSPFGGFKTTGASSAFGAPPAFGASTPAQPAATGGLFGASNTSGGLFGSGAPTAAAPAFGTPSSGFSFGASTSTGGGGLFSNNPSTGGLFANTQQNNAFGAKPAGFGFGSTTTNPTQSSGLFGNPPASTGLFGQQNTSLGGGGLFSNNAGAFGQQTATGTGHVKYNPVVGSDVVVKGGSSQNISVKHHCITCMKEYEGKSLEELRLEDYTAGRKGSAGGAMYPFQQQQQAAKPLFGASTSFGGAATTSAPSVFGGGLGAGGAFGQTNSFAFGGNTQANTSSTGLFGAAKPAFGATPSTGTGLFGSTATTQAPAFGTSTAPSFGFGGNMQNQSTGGIFGAKPATSSVFGTPSTGLGAFGGGGLFAAKPTQTQAPTFGAPQPGLGTTALGFGANTSTSGGLFGGGAFNKPATSQPGFGFGTTQPTLGTGLGGNAFQTKPATAPFGQLGTTNMFQNPNANTSLNLGGGMGGASMFGNTSSLGNSSLGLGMNANNTLANNLSGASAAGNVHEQILTLAARPYGDSPLFKDLLPDSSTTAEDALRPTNPAAMQAVLDKAASSYRVTSPNGTRLKLQPKTAQAQHKKSLFDGLEEYDASLEDKLSLKPSRKRLVLRSNQQTNSANDSADLSHAAASYRSQEDLSQSQSQYPETNGEAREGETETTTAAPPRANETDAERAKRNISFENNSNLDMTSDRQGSWLSASKMPWGDGKEKPIDNEPTPRLYPSLDKELPSDGAERRASWLTTKHLRKPLVSPPQSAEHSVRELDIRPPKQTSPDNKENMLSDSTLDSEFGKNSEGDNTKAVSWDRISLKIGKINAADEIPPPREAPPHPAGIKLTREGYYTIPSLEEMKEFTRPDGTCILPELTIGRRHYGNVHYDCEVNVTGLDLDQLVHFFNKEVVIYPDDGVKPPVGEGLNKRAIVTLDRVWPRDKTQNRPITEPDRLWEFERKLRRVCEKHETKFIEYRPETGSWVFRVEHFSKYGLTDSDEEDDVTPEVLRRQLANQALQNNAAPSMIPPVSSQSPGLGGLGGLGALAMKSPGLGGLGLGVSASGMSLTSPDLPVTSGLGVTSPSVPMSHGVGSDSIFAMQQASLNLLSGARGFEMDTTEDNTESQSLYQDNRAYGVKSPTTELARLEHRQSHHVQLMKASLYADTEMEDDISISTGDQLVPMCTTLPSLPEVAHSLPTAAEREDSARTLLPHTEEAEMPPLLVKPHTIILKYHRKVPPFKHTIAGRLGAKFMSDLSVARARHSRVGFGPRGDIVFATTYDAVADLDTTAELSELDQYTRGRESHDWSEAVVARLALQHPDHHYNVQDVLGRQLDTLFKYSEFVDDPPAPAPAGEQCPRLRLVEGAGGRHAALRGLLDDAARVRGDTRKWGVSGAYCYEVWKLCDALWGADLLNGGIPGTDDLSIVNRHRSFLQWLTEAVAKITDEELSVPRKAEDDDESDSHSGRVWTLLVGGRVLEACKVARDKGDFNLATLIAQAAGDPAFRGLISRQLSQWRECGADTLISSHKRAILHLIAGIPPREHLSLVHWLQALHATARFLCPQVPSLEQVLRKYESLFTHEEHDSSNEEVDLTIVDGDEMGMSLPVPPYADSYDVVQTRGGRQARMLDLRYELIRARALNARPAPRPAHCTCDPLDHTLCFVLGVWFGNPSEYDVVGVADQLEAAGAWHLAVQALCYHPNATARNHLIRNVLSRHAPAKADTPELKARLELVKKLRVPEKWLLIAQAHRAKYEHQPALEAEHLAAAEQWNPAHQVLMQDILPTAVLSDTLHLHASLVEKLHAAAQECKVAGWQHGGDAVYLYLTLCTEIRGLVSGGGAGAGAAVRARLEALRPAVAGACRALPRQPHTTARAAAARAEMGAHLVQLAVAAGEPAHHLAALLRILALPPDCTANAQHKIAMDLAEQASELCIESPSSSPISSHHRATAATS